ncbi:MAG TPA: DNA oxidative demethylase AlkB [Bryobacteraceae bacterium]|nr:DNA oxidative demethylase AlkB [Bryobacteraceae bacterium]
MAGSEIEVLCEGATLLHRFVASHAPKLLDDVAGIAREASFRQMVTPGGSAMSVAMTNCGEVGWVSDRRGYRYDPLDPETGKPWPAMPGSFRKIALRAAEVAGFPDFRPDACLINRYRPGARMGLHQDKDEQDFAQPIVSVSLGLPAVFLFGGVTRKQRPRRIPLENGDVVVWGGPARLVYHGIAPLAEPTLLDWYEYRFNLTFRKAL